MKSFVRFKLTVLVAVGAGFLIVSAPAEDRADPANAAQPEMRYNRDIRPILSNHCFKCHGPDLKKSGLDLQNADAARKTLKSGNVAFVPGKAKESQLIERVGAGNDDPRHMPPKGERLKPEQIAKLTAWIDQGAKYEEHWAYVKPLHPPLPSVKDRKWPRNGIDYFVLAQLETEGLAPSPEAERTTLIRRVCLDLTGLPPTLEQVDAFLGDKAEDAYEKMVDRLLASPAYGEHQARYWLDQARYADTNGYEKDDRRTIWPYRDWVINAFNRDLPFDQFTIEQIAGDLLPNATREQKIATGFQRNTMVNTEGGIDDEEFRVAAVVDRVNTTMDVWMGTTSACT
jgi:mono/diheme cytochrome c family protein